MIGHALQGDSAGYSYGREKHAANMLLAAALLWQLGSVLNSCQVYERADGRAQLLQTSVQVPTLLGSLLFLVAAVLNRRGVSGSWRREPAVLVVSRFIRPPRRQASRCRSTTDVTDRDRAIWAFAFFFRAQGRSWASLCLLGSLLWLAAALLNVLKVFMMHQSDALRLEKLRGGAQERLSSDREGRVPLNWEEAARRRALPTELR